MRLAYILVTGLLLLPSLATAGKESDEEFLALDLSALPEGSEYFLKCSNTAMKSTLECGIVSVWEQTNAFGGLQTSFASLHGKAWDPDTRLLS